MAIKDKSLDLIHEKQELALYLSSIKAIQQPDDVAREKVVVSVEAEKKLPVIDQGKSLNLIHEKEETEIFLSSMTTVRPPDEIMQEKTIVSTETDEKLPVSDHLSAYKEPEIQILSDEAAQPDKAELGKIVIASRSKEDMQISVALLKEEKAVKDSLSDMKDTNEEQPQTGDQSIKDKAMVVMEPPSLVQAQEVAIQMSDAVVDVLPSDKIGNAEQTVVLKSQQKTEISPETPSVKKDEKLEKLTPEPSKKKSKQVSVGNSIRLFALFLVFIVVIEGYLWLYPDVGYQTIEWMHSNIPMMDQLLGIEKAQQDIITDQVEFINVKQRFVKNESLGNIRVIEGEVVNRADFPVAKIKVMGELFDSSEALLAACISYCGNVLPDETLGRLKEEEIRSALSVSSGGNLSNNKILPKGQLPFMIVFTHEPTGVVKATVTAVGAERISP
jgi:hypothetical protein